MVKCGTNRAQWETHAKCGDSPKRWTSHTSCCDVKEEARNDPTAIKASIEAVISDLSFELEQ